MFKRHDMRLSVQQVQLLTLTAIAVSLFGLYITVSGFRSEASQAVAVLTDGNSVALRDYLRSFGSWAPLISLLLMDLQALVAPVPGFLIVFANGLVFGVFWGWVLSLAGQALAAAICFWIARSLGRAPAEALAGKLGINTADRWFSRWGVFGILFLRLIPGIGFDAVSFTAGVTSISFSQFFVATLVGVAPQSLLYAYMGHTSPRVVIWLLTINAILIASITLGMLVHRRRARSERSPD
jgi:uncharacterized membrane protein YdjX (TVP38/TMEM64 family)